MPTDGDKGCVSGSVRQDFQQGRKLLQSAYSTSIAGIQNATREGMELAPDEASSTGKDGR